MKAESSLYRTRPLPRFTAKLDALLGAAEELRLICGGKWRFLQTALWERRMDDEDQDVALWPELPKVGAKFWRSYRNNAFGLLGLKRTSAAPNFHDFCYDLAVAFGRASGQLHRFRLMRSMYRWLNVAFDRASMRNAA